MSTLVTETTARQARDLQRRASIRPTLEMFLLARAMRPFARAFDVVFSYLDADPRWPWPTWRVSRRPFDREID